MPGVHEDLFNECAQVLRKNPPATALQRICTLLHKRLAHYSWVGVYVVRGNDLHLAAWDGAKPTQHSTIPLNTGLCGWAATTGELLNVPDVSKDRRYLACFSETKSELVVPIIVQGKAVGEIDVDSDQIRAFTREDEVFCNRLAVEMATLVRGMQQGSWTPITTKK